jgi:hypothetical protein
MDGSPSGSKTEAGTRRSRRAPVIFAWPDTPGHSPDSRFVVMITEVCW